MKILYADAVDERHLGGLVDEGHEYTIDAGLTAESLPDAISGYDVLVVRSTKVNAAAIEQGDALSLIVRAGAGTDNIDKNAASDRGVLVCNVPGRNAIAVAELTLGLLMAIERRIVDNTTDLRSGDWNKSQYSKADGVFGKTLGIIGLGDIGLAVAERAKAFGVTVNAVRKGGRSPEVEAAIRRIGIRMVDSTDELLAESDIVTLHVPKSPETIGLVDSVFLSKMKPTGILINTARGDIVDEDALLKALDSTELRAGLDVWDNEPGKGTGAFDSSLAKHPKVVGTHHIGASTDQAQRSVALGTVETILAFCEGSPVNSVNLRSGLAGQASLTVRHLDRVGVLAQVFAILRSRGINVQEMQNQIFDGGQAAVATIGTSSQPDPETVAQLNQIDEVFHVSATSLNNKS